MLRYIFSRLLYMLPVVWLVVSVVFLLIHLVPGDPIQQMLGEGAAATDIAAARHAYGLDVPLSRQYVNYWRGIVHGDMGKSLRLNQPVGHIIADAYPYTMELTLAALIVALALSIPAGVRSALRRNRWDDRAAQLCLAAWAVVSELRTRADSHFVFRNSAGVAAGIGRGRSGTSDPAGHHHGWSAGGNPHAHGAHLDAGRTWAGLHPYRARERSA